MMLIPELQLVLLLTPRTGSSSLRRAVAAKYPKSMLIYRHMEADGVPHGYDHWEKVGVLRHPVERLWSLYKFLKQFEGNHDPAYIAAMRASARMSFSSWIVENQLPFTAPYDSAGLGRYFPRYTVNHPLPENRKSQHVYLRPDLGTTVFLFEDLHVLADKLEVRLGKQNCTCIDPSPPLTSAAEEHCLRYFAWDFQQYAELEPDLVARFHKFCMRKAPAMAVSYA